MAIPKLQPEIPVFVDGVHRWSMRDGSILAARPLERLASVSITEGARGDRVVLTGDGGRTITMSGYRPDIDHIPKQHILVCNSAYKRYLEDKGLYEVIVQVDQITWLMCRTGRISDGVS